jgi:hypothetical protein
MHLKAGNILSLVTSSAADIDVSVSYRDEGTIKSALHGVKNTAITTATTTTILEGNTSGASGVTRVVASMSIRNVDVTSNDVTVMLNDGTTDVEVFKTTLAAGSQLAYVENSGWVVATTTPTGATLYTATADVVNSAADTLANFTGLTHTVEAGDKYRFRAVCHYSADATTSGSRWTINGPAATAASTGYASRYTLTATTETVNHGLAAVQLPAAANLTTAATTGNVAVVEGFYTPSAAGTFAIQFAAEAGTITGKAGSTLEIMKVIDA